MTVHGEASGAGQVFPARSIATRDGAAHHGAGLRTGARREARRRFTTWALVAAISSGGCATPARAWAASSQREKLKAGAPADEMPMTAANRTSGMAPLLVFFDAVDTTDTGPDAPFTWSSGVAQPADLEGATYSWDFGDPASGNWGTTGRSKNTATGYTAAHVYETPGTYVVRLTVTDTTGVTTHYQETVSVSEFTGTTYYVAADGSDSNDGRAPSTPFQSFGRGIAALNAGGKRLLFRRGDTFPTGSSKTLTLTAAGPGLMGAYGTGADPIIDSSLPDGHSDPTLLTNVRDWRFVDLDFRTPYATNSSPGALGPSPIRQSTDLLFLRVKTTGFRVGLGNGTARTIFATPHDGNGWVECEVNAPYVNGMYVGGRRLTIMGCNLHDPLTSHVLRVWQAHKGVISNNRLWNPGATRHALKLHGPPYGNGQPETRWVTVTDNLIRGKTWSVTIGPQDSFNDERVSHVVFERNRFSGEPSVQIDMQVSACHVMVRNNVFDATGSGRSYAALAVRRRGIEPAPVDVRILHNTVARADPAQRFQLLQVGPDAQEISVRSNLASAPLAASTALLGEGAAARSLVLDHNLIGDGNPFTDLSAGKLGLRRGAKAVDAGVMLPEVRTDFLGVPRPRGSAPDVGAFESY